MWNYKKDQFPTGKNAAKNFRCIFVSADGLAANRSIPFIEFINGSLTG